jgi:hypothetical protein
MYLTRRWKFHINYLYKLIKLISEKYDDHIFSLHLLFKQKYEQTKRKVIEMKRTQLMTNTGKK